MKGEYVTLAKNREAVRDIRKILRSYKIYSDKNVKHSLDVLIDLTEGKRGVGLKRKKMVACHGLVHCSEVLKSSLDNFIAYDSGKFSKDKETLKMMAIAILLHDSGYFLNEEHIDFGTMKIGHEEKSIGLVRKLILNHELRLDYGEMAEVNRMVHSTIMSKPLEVGSLNDPVEVAAMIISSVDILGTGKDYIESIPGLYLEFKSDFETLNKLLKKKDVRGIFRARIRREIDKIPLKSGPIEQIANTKNFWDYVYDVRLKSVLKYIRKMGWATKNRKKIESIYQADEGSREELLKKYGLMRCILRASRVSN